MTEPDTGPGLASKVRGARAAGFFTCMPALWMMAAPFSMFATAVFCQFKLRIPPFLHRQLALEAEENHVSLNRLISAKLASG